MNRLIIKDNKVERVGEKPRTFWTARNLVGGAGIAGFVVWALWLIIGGR